MQKLLFFTLLLAALLSGCVSNQKPGGSSLVNNPNNNRLTSDVVDNPTDLTAYLNRISGVVITGNGAAAQIRIRGPISFNGRQDPLFVVDGSKRGFDYSSIYNSINVRDVKSVRVLKNASETAMYGTQGSAGVIEITIKKKSK